MTVENDYDNENQLYHTYSLSSIHLGIRTLKYKYLFIYPSRCFNYFSLSKD